MNSHLKHGRSGVAMVGLLVGLAIVSVPGACADGQQPAVFPAEESVFGLTYGDWSAAWWQYVLSIPTGTNPVLDTTGTNCAVGQSSGPVFFLTGAATADPVTRTCTVPAGKALVLPMITAECSTVESPPFFGGNGQELRTCAAAFVDGVDRETLQVSIDGQHVQDLSLFRVQSPLFAFIMPTATNFLGLPSVTSGSSVSDGYWLLLKPLSPGTHVIHFEGAFVSGPGAGFSQNVTYTLSVTP